MLHLIIKMFAKLMQKTAMHSISTATRNQSKGEIFPNLTFDAFTAVATLVGKKQSIKKEEEAPFPNPPLTPNH